jgi:putative acetyltransferase
MLITVRTEAAGDQPSVRQINERAFGHSGEADLVAMLRESVRPYISLVAVSDGQLVGHILFSPVSVVSEGTTYSALALGPMSVLPDFQNRGVGSRLVRRGLEVCRDSGHEVVVVIGHPWFYPRFGFVPARQKGLDCEYPVPDEVFMAAELRVGALAELKGVVKYHPEFDKV